MKKLTLIIVLFVFISCSSDPEPLRYGKDICYSCKMTLVDRKFGAEIVTKKGKVYKFDDLNCMVGFYNSDYEVHENMEHILVIDFAHPGTLIDVQQAFFVKTSEIRTPMAGGIAAFSNKEDQANQNEKWKGTLLEWPDVIAEFK
ncbi:MAG: nitrous oxide reductase accessory protein NosL [Cyclobacteriaceae bacterium]|nr:nitrous oxide reductase accessory protein NosL [Cyclobacteriaceae bacterium]